MCDHNSFTLEEETERKENENTTSGGIGAREKTNRLGDGAKLIQKRERSRRVKVGFLNTDSVGTGNEGAESGKLTLTDRGVPTKKTPGIPRGGTDDRESTGEGVKVCGEGGRRRRR